MQGTRTSQFVLPGNDRGAVFLLAVYLTALFLLVLSGISLQRSTHEQRMSTIARDTQQAFWLAEAGLDRALNCVQDNELTKTSCTFQELANGIATPQWSALEAQVTSLSTQQVAYQLSGVGTPTNSSYTEQVNARVDTAGPLQGAWAQGVVAINLTAGAMAVDGSVYSGNSSLVASVANGTWKLEGIARTDEDGTTAAKLEAVEESLSNEMRDLKAGFKFFNNIKTTSPKNTDGIKFIPTNAVGSANSEYVSGVLNVSFEDDVEGETPTYCSVSLIPDVPLEDMIVAHQQDLPGGEFIDGGIVIEDGFRYQRKDHQATRDIKAGDDKITLCVNSIVPNTTAGVANALLFNQPPKVIFRQPATIYVSGHQTYDFTADPSLNFLVSVMNAFPALGFEPMNHTKHVWDVTLAAELSAVDAEGHVIPNGVKIIQRREGKEDKTKAGLVNIKPGHFSGSVYTPHSLVVLRARDAEHLGEDYDVQYVVGSEIAIDIAKGDEINLGIKKTEGVSVKQTATTVLSWEN